MNTDLHQFVTKYLSIVFGTLMLVSFCAFVTIPYSLSVQPGEDVMARTSSPVAAPQLAADTLPAEPKV